MDEKDAFITTNLTPLGPGEQRQARYLSALAEYRALAAAFAEAGQADTAELCTAAAEVMRWEPTPEERMRPIREVAEVTDISVATIRRWARDNQVAAEKRYGKLWYVDLADVERRVAAEPPARGWPLGKSRPKVPVTP